MPGLGEMCSAMEKALKCGDVSGKECTYAFARKR